MDDPSTGRPLNETIRQPGLVWCYQDEPERGAGHLRAQMPAGDGGFRWVHLNLSDQRSLRWLEEEAALPAPVHALMLERGGQQRFSLEGGALGLVLHDYERDFEPGDMARIGGLHIAILPGMMITGRYRPLHAADLFRSRLEGGQGPRDPAAALAFLLGVMIDSLSSLVIDLTATLLEAEEGLMAEERAPDTRELVSARRRAAQLHRMTGGMRMVLQRVEYATGLPDEWAAVVRAAQPRLVALDQDIVAAQNQLKLLRDELDLEAAQRTNANVYLLSVLTALMMPATLVTGFFGMNTGGMPFEKGAGGTVMATLVALGSGVASYLLLRMMGLVRRR